jgi:hypothetical protein
MEKATGTLMASNTIQAPRRITGAVIPYVLLLASASSGALHAKPNNVADDTVIVLYTDAVKMARETFVEGVIGNDIDSRPCHCKECEETLKEAQAEAARRYKEEP